MIKLGDSKIGKRPINLVNGVDVTVEKEKYPLLDLVTVKGPLGTLTQTIKPQVQLKIGKGIINLVQNRDDPQYDKALHGTYRTLIQNMIFDSSIGYLVQLELHGIGFRAFFRKKDGKDDKTLLCMRLGTTHDVEFPVPDDILIIVDKEGVGLTVYGCDRRRVTQEAKKIRLLKRPEPYKGKGIRYKGEVIKMKAVKKKSGK